MSMKVELHERRIVHEILHHVLFPFNLFLLEFFFFFTFFFFFLLLWLKTNLETWNFAEKSCSEEIRADYFKMAPLFFLKFGHIDWLLLYFVKVVCFFYFHYTICCKICGNDAHFSYFILSQWTVYWWHCKDIMKYNFFFPCYK